MGDSKWIQSGFGTQKKSLFPLNRGVPSIEVADTKITRAFFRDQILCPLNGGVPGKAMSKRRGSTVFKNKVHVQKKSSLRKNKSFIETLLYIHEASRRFGSCEKE